MIALLANNPWPQTPYNAIFILIARDQRHPKSCVVQCHHPWLLVRDHSGGNFSLSQGSNFCVLQWNPQIIAPTQFIHPSIFSRSPSECTTTTTRCLWTISPSTPSLGRACSSWQVWWPSVIRSSLLLSCVAKRSKLPLYLLHNISV